MRGHTLCVKPLARIRIVVHTSYKAVTSRKQLDVAPVQGVADVDLDSPGNHPPLRHIVALI